MQEEFSIIDFLKIAVCTWNMGGNKPYAEVDLKSWLLPEISNVKDAPDIFVIGFQHIVPNKGFRRSANNKDRITFMQNNVMTILNTHASQACYTIVRQVEQHGLFLLLIAKAEVQTRIFDVAMAEVKPPMGNRSGKKGAVMVRFGIEDTSFVFMNCHLAGGFTYKSVEERAQ